MSRTMWWSVVIINEMSKWPSGWVVDSRKAALLLCFVWQDWRNIELIHIFQEQLITGSRFLTTDRRSQSNLEGLVNLENAATFNEHFFLVVVERTEANASMSSSCTIHMWCLVISSQGISVCCRLIAMQQLSHVASFYSPQSLGAVSIWSLNLWGIWIWIITGPPTHSVGGQTRNGHWCLSLSSVVVVCRGL